MIENFTEFRKRLMRTNTATENLSVVDSAHFSEERYAGIDQDRNGSVVVHYNVEKVKNVDEKVVELTLKVETDKVEPSAGFLVEVYSSGSDGILTRMFQNDVLDLYGKVTEQGFSDFLVLEIDRET